jgi:hypothetical protein
VSIRAAALPRLPALAARWLPDGRLVGAEFVARNPTRADRRAGSFKINVRTGQWADFATGDRGGDVISLAAYLFRISQFEAARRLSAMLGGVS